jgi:hypothetical protein
MYNDNQCTRSQGEAIMNDQLATNTLAILELYKLRTEPLMREARAWFVTQFAPETGKDIIRHMLSGQKESAYYRMVASYWETAASLVNNGGIDEKLFLEANSEHLVVFAKLQPFVSEIRELLGEPDYLYHLEKLVLSVPNIERKLENRRKLLLNWKKLDSATQAA